MVENLVKHSKEVLDNFKEKVKATEEKPLTIQEQCLVSIAESLIILSEKISRKLP